MENHNFQWVNPNLSQTSQTSTGPRSRIPTTSCRQSRWEATHQTCARPCHGIRRKLAFSVYQSWLGIAHDFFRRINLEKISWRCHYVFFPLQTIQWTYAGECLGFVFNRVAKQGHVINFPWWDVSYVYGQEFTHKRTQGPWFLMSTPPHKIYPPVNLAMDNQQ